MLGKETVVNKKKRGVLPMMQKPPQLGKRDYKLIIDSYHKGEWILVGDAGDYKVYLTGEYEVIVQHLDNFQGVVRVYDSEGNLMVFPKNTNYFKLFNKTVGETLKEV